jgi:hypothetical protein
MIARIIETTVASAILALVAGTAAAQGPTPDRTKLHELLFPKREGKNKAHLLLLELADADRNVMLAKFLRESGEQCDTVVRNFHQGTAANGDAFWNVACRDGNSYAISILGDDTTKILPCSALKALGAGVCFRPF